MLHLPDVNYWKQRRCGCTPRGPAHGDFAEETGGKSGTAVFRPKCFAKQEPMEQLRETRRCAVCGRARASREWFLLAENRWEDKVIILQWNPKTAGTQKMRAACSSAHVRELIVHWMNIGDLNFPNSVRHSQATNPLRSSRQNDIDLAGAVQVGELSVDRASIQRILIENPGSLTVILDELSYALDSKMPNGNENRKTNLCHWSPRQA